MISFKDILVNIVKELKESNILFGQTKLIKLAYLIELEYYRKHRERLTSENWVYYKFGPYIMDYPELLKASRLEVQEESDERGFKKIELDEYFEIPKLPEEIHRLTKRIVKEFGDLSLNKLLNFVYFETEPMMNANARQEVLRFDTAMPAEYYHVKTIKSNSKIKEKIKKKYKESIESGVHF